MLCDVTLDQRGCVHGDASFHHDIECPCSRVPMAKVLAGPVSCLDVHCITATPIEQVTDQPNFQIVGGGIDGAVLAFGIALVSCYLHSLHVFYHCYAIAFAIHLL